MATIPRAQQILGLDTTAPGQLDARAVLSAMSSDDEPAQGHSGPKVPADGTWMRITGLPPSAADAANPFELALAGAADGEHTALSVLAHHSDALGTRLFVSAGHPGVSERLRAQLAPGCDVVSAKPPTNWRQWRGYGVCYRLQAEVGRVGESNPARSTLLDRLVTVQGEWAVFLTFDNVKQLDVRDAQRAAVRLDQFAAEHLSSDHQEAVNRSKTVVSAEWARVQAWIDTLLDQLAEGGADGYWTVGAWAYGREQWAAAEAAIALRGAVQSHQGRRFMAYQSPITNTGTVQPLSLLTTLEAAGVLASPRVSSPGLTVRPAPPAARRPDASGKLIELGHYWSTDISASIGLSDLEGHAFVTGSTGSGKTSTLHRLLAEAWNEHGIPFLLIDPVKDEYSDIANRFAGGIQLVTGQELSLNVMAAAPGDDQRQHVAQVAQAFKGAFTMPSPTPYVVTQLFDQVAMQPGGPSGTELYDVRDSVGSLVDALGYAAEAQSNIRASLLTRLNLLLAPTRAHRFAWPDSSMVDQLFTRPTVVTLADLVDEEERSFLVLLLALATWSRARRRPVTRAVEHLLVLEEAHRVLPEVRDLSADPESGSAKSTSSQLLSNMLAEVRSYGEQVIVVDQSPSKVASDVVRNTNLKIVHRTVAGDDQKTMAAAVGLPEEQASLFGSLARGEVIVSTSQEPSPQTIAISQAVSIDASAKPVPVLRADARWPCCEGKAPERHYRAWQASNLAEGPMALFLMACRVGSSTESLGDAARSRVSTMLTHLERSVGASANCLTWAGLRRLLVAERNSGLLPSAIAVNTVLESLYGVWADEAAAMPASAKSHGMPPTGRAAICPDCGIACYVRAPAWAWASSGPRTGLSALRGANWRSELTGVWEWAASEVRTLEQLLGAEGSRRVVRCQVHQAVNRAYLGSDVAATILKRAGFDDN
jgi:hypothetical protein